MKQIALLLLLLPALLFAAGEGSRRRGKYLRTEIRDATVITDFQFQPLTDSGSFLTFQFEKIQTRSYQEVRLYEVVEEIAKFQEGEGITPQGTVEYVPVPNAVMEGEIIPHEETTVTGPLANQKLLLMGKVITTDDQGLWIDAKQEILAKFDTLSQTSLDIIAAFPDGVAHSFTMTRFLLRQQEEQPIPGVQKTMTVDVLEALGLDFVREIAPSANLFSASVAFPETAEAGSFHPVTVTVKNEEEKPIRNLFGCIFSSDPTLNGKLFYFGKLLPGKSLSFSRILQLPEKEGDCFFTIAFWSILGPVPEPRLHQKIHILPRP